MSVVNYDHGDDDHEDGVIHSVSKSHSQSVNQSAITVLPKAKANIQ